MALRFRRRDARRNGLRGVLASDVTAIGSVLAEAVPRDHAVSSELDLAPLAHELFARAATADVRAVATSGIDAATFVDTELRPNWDGLTRGERSAKIESFMRLANVLGTDDAAGIGPLVRTKVMLLAWAYDEVYGEDLLDQIVRKPQRFGTLELAHNGHG